MSASGPTSDRKGVQATTIAGTPSPFPACATLETLDGLEFSQVLDVVAERAACALGAAAVRARVPVADPDTVRSEIARVAALADLLRAGEPAHPESVSDIEAHLARLAVAGSVLDGVALLALGRALEAMGAVAARLERLAERAPQVAELLVPVPPKDVGEAIVRALDPDGAVRDGVDKTVDRARDTVRQTRKHLLDVLDRTVKGLASHEAPADAAATLRDGRYVIPVAKDARGRVPGIVHGESGSGATLFVEPQEAVEVGNALNAAQAAEARAVLALLRQLCERARPHLAEVAGGWRMCIRFDDLSARARYAVDVDAAPPALVPTDGAHVLRGARHSLLLAEGVDAVPFDLELEPGESAVVVSGPNAGGKTVMLKTVGLASALVQAGIVPPLDEGSTLPIFGRLIADIGDHQSIEANLSTYSAHLATLREALEVADAETLVLFDEIGSGTDPNEGAALAGAAIETLARRRSRVVATTHLGALKRLASETEGIVNASLHFDAETLSPTYRFAKGVPGRSYGLVMARRLGVPEAVLVDAERRTTSEEQSLDALLADAERRTRELADRDVELRAEEARAASAATEIERREAELLAREREMAKREKRAEREGRDHARRFLLDARKRVEEALGVARAAVSEATAKEARRLVEQGISEEGHELKRLEEELAKKGWTVRAEGGRIKPPVTDGPPVPRSAGPAADVAVNASPEVDLRGMMADEATEVVTRALDSAILADLPVLRIIHGKGTGKLRAVVGELLQRDRRVTAHRIAPPNEGGTGVTIAELGG